jgi:mRNA interferase MazF
MTRGEVVWLRSLRGSKGHELRGARYAVVLQTELVMLSTVIVAPTSTHALTASFRPEIELEGVRTHVMLDHLTAVDVSRIGDSVRILSGQELATVDQALATVLGLER